MIQHEKIQIFFYNITGNYTVSIVPVILFSDDCKSILWSLSNTSAKHTFGNVCG